MNNDVDGALVVAVDVEVPKPEKRLGVVVAIVVGVGCMPKTDVVKLGVGVDVVVLAPNKFVVVVDVVVKPPKIGVDVAVVAASGVPNRLVEFVLDGNFRFSA